MGGQPWYRPPQGNARISSVILTAHAQQDLQRLAVFLHDNGAIERAKNLANLLLDKIDLLAISPKMGHLYHFLPEDFVLNQSDESREMVIKYGKSAYKILYFYQTLTDTVIVVAIKHSKEKTYPLFS